MSALFKKSSAFGNSQITIVNPQEKELKDMEETLTMLGFEVTYYARIQTVYEVIIKKPNMRDMSFSIKDGISISDIINIYSQLGLVNSECKEELDKEVDRLVREVSKC